MAPNRQLDNSLKQAVAYLARAQESNGGFMGEASVDPRDFSRMRLHPTTFFTALILNCLQDVPETSLIRKQAAGFLIAQKSPGWSWNYWQRESEAARNRPYPDDLDDTACALVALHRQDPSLIDGEVLANFAKQLITIEVAPGGPYTTWIVGTDADAIWRDIDIAVNANIGFLLSLQSVQLPGLEKYIGDAISNDELISPYYVGEVPILYFLSRWYRGPEIEALGQIVKARLADPVHRDNPLTQALLLTAGLNLGLSPDTLTPVAKVLLQSQANGAWPAAALYFEPPVQGIRHYAGSQALTTAFCAEALAAYRHACASKAAYSRLPQPDVAPKDALRLAVVTGDDLAPDLRRLYISQIELLVGCDHNCQITGIATTVAAAFGLTIDEKTLAYLNTGSVLGWNAYTIYDDFWDQEGEPELLGVANVALRRAVANFRAALPEHQEFHRLIEDTLDCVDGANTWEAVHARATVSQGVVKIDAMPDYSDYRQLAQRSCGHMLAATGVLAQAGYDLKSTEIQQLQRFFHDYLIARQLCDDAHDWEGDLAHGRITPAVALLAGQGQRKIQFKRELVQLQQRFWQRTMDELVGLVQIHSDSARAALQSCATVCDNSQLLNWLEATEQSMKRALLERAKVEKFVSTYRGTTPPN